jgi:hypothetical protein
LEELMARTKKKKGKGKKVLVSAPEPVVQLDVVAAMQQLEDAKHRRDLHMRKVLLQGTSFERNNLPATCKPFVSKVRKAAAVLKAARSAEEG